MEKAKGREWKNQRFWPGPPAMRPVEAKKWEAVPPMTRETIPAVVEPQMVQPSQPMNPSAPPSGEAEEL